MTQPIIAVCSTESYFADDVAGACAVCRAAVYLRPETARLADASSRLCPRCFLAHRDESWQVCITRRTLDELRLYFAVTGRRQ